MSTWKRGLSFTGGFFPLASIFSSSAFCSSVSTGGSW